MIRAINCAALSTALENLKKIVKDNEISGKKTVIFCEDRLSLAAERTVCAAVEGSFLTSVYTFARFLATERGADKNVLSAQGSAMAIRRIIDTRRNDLKLFKKLSSQSAAQTVYDTLALFYSSRVTAEEVAEAAKRDSVPGGKLRDLALIYSDYENFLKESGKKDRNGYLKQLAEVIEQSPKIRGSAVIFLGFQAFTMTVTECAAAAFSVAESVYGLFIGGDEEMYVNEALPEFLAAAKPFGGATVSSDLGERNAEAEALRRGLFEPESFRREKLPSNRVHLFEATDGEEELEFIAASIKRHVIKGGVRYAKISVMLPDIERDERELARVFKRYRIPYYADRRFSLFEHPLCDFIVNYLLCAYSGCVPADVDAVVASPFFPAERGDKDIFRNYALKFCGYRGGVKREPNAEVLKAAGFGFEAVERVRLQFLKGLAILTSNGVKSGICGGLRSLLKAFAVEEKLQTLKDEFTDIRPAAAELCARAYSSVLSVLDECEGFIGEGLPLNEFIKVLKSGFYAAKISLIPPKSDAVFVGDLGATANTGSTIVFAARLTGDVPGASADCCLLTDREIAALEGVNLNISPKIRQVNARKREFVAMNVCAFREQLYLSYPTRLDGEESGVSEIVSYAKAIFCNASGGDLKALDIKRLEKSGRATPYYCSESQPALKYLSKRAQSDEAGSVYEVLCRHGYSAEAEAALKKRVAPAISCGKRLFLNRDSITPTALETYFSCPYLNFMRQGLRVREREEGAVRAVDTGNFIHSVLQDLAKEMDKIPNDSALKARADELARGKLSCAPYSSLLDSKGGRYAADALVSEAVTVSEGMYSQIKNSTFKVAAAERGSEVTLKDGIKVFGRIDRVDESGDMVRVIDYKTGSIDSSISKYYTGAKLQLPLYLLASSEGKRAVGAYYFPAAVEFSDKKDGVFRLQGFMDGSSDVVAASDTLTESGKKSDFVDAYQGAKNSGNAMPREDFSAFLQYSKLVAGKGVEEIISGNVAPSPAADTCKYCKAGGSCGFAVGRDGAERKVGAVKSGEIAELVKREEGGNE